MHLIFNRGTWSLLVGVGALILNNISRCEKEGRVWGTEGSKIESVLPVRDLTETLTVLAIETQQLWMS